MSDEPRQDEAAPAEDKAAKDARASGAFEEALDAAEVFSELADEAARPGPSPAGADLGHEDSRRAEPSGFDEAAGFEEAAFADEFDLTARPGAEAERILAEALDRELSGRTAIAAGAEVPGSEPEPVAPFRIERPSPAMAGDAYHSIGMLFKSVVSHSPPSKIRVEADSVGALFRRFIEQE